MALDRLGQAPIGVITQTTGNGPLCSRHYDSLRRSLLHHTWWTFARSEISLALLGNNQWQNWAYAYQYPVDCLRINYLMNPNLVASYIGYPYSPAMEEFYYKNCPHEVTQALDANNNATGHKVILTNMENAILVYTKDVTDVALFPDPFAQVLVLRLARALCHKLLPNSSILADIKQELVEVENMALGTSSNESVEHAAMKSDFERYRN